MNKGLKIGLNAFVALMIVIGVVLCALLFAESTEIAQGTGNESLIDKSVILVVIQIAIAAIVAVVAGLVLFGMNIKKRIGAVVGFALFAILGLIAFYVLADNSTAGFIIPDSEQEVSAGTAQFVDGGLNFFYILVGLAVALALLGSAWTFLKKTVLKS